MTSLVTNQGIAAVKSSESNAQMAIGWFGKYKVEPP